MVEIRKLIRSKGRLSKIRNIRQSSKKAGSPPGTLQHLGEQKMEKMTMVVTDFSTDSLVHQEIEHISEVDSYLKRDSITWIKVQGLHEVEKLREIGDYFNLHPLVLEDILNTGQRSKKEDYEQYMFFVLRLLNHIPEKDEILSEQFAIVLGSNYVLTFQESDFPHFEIINERLKVDNSRLRKMGADYLSYALIDIVVDYYFHVLENFGDRMEAVEDELLLDARQETHHTIHDLRRELLNLRKIIWPLRDMLNSTIRDETPYIKTATKVYLRDVYDHVVQMMDAVESNRDVIMGMFDTYMSVVSNKMNEVMKVLTIIATIFIPLTFIAGVYGMNFNPEASPWNMPELNAYWGYPVTWSVMLLVTIGMVLYFRRKGWF